MRKLFLLLMMFAAIATTANAQQKVSDKSVRTLLSPAHENGKWGYKRGGNWVIQPQYEKACIHDQQGFGRVQLNGKWGVIDRYGDMVIPCRYDEMGLISKNLISVKLNGKWGYIDLNGDTVIPYNYEDAMPFSESLAPVKLNGKWGYIDLNGNTVIPYSYEGAMPFSNGLAYVATGSIWRFIDKAGKWYDKKNNYTPPLFSKYAKRYVENAIYRWQEKGQYEKIKDWQVRVNEETRKKKVEELTQEAREKYIAEMGNAITISQELNGYDTENETFLIKDDYFGDLLVPVPVAEAPAFEKEFSTRTIKRDSKYSIDNDRLALAEMSFTTTDNKSYTYNNSASLDYVITDFDYDLSPIEIDESAVTKTQRGEQNIKYARQEQSKKSDVDIDIPKAKSVNENTFAVIIANEQYKHEQDVPYAKTDGESFQNYCVNTLGLPEKNVRFHADATLNEMRMEMKWLKDIGESFGGDAKVIFYYAGHGVADDKSRSAFLLPVDGSGTVMETGYPTDMLYAQLGELPVSSVVVFLDACFSGAVRDGSMMVASRGVALKPKNSVLQEGNIVVLSATTGDETAAMHPEQGHGLFTYFLLKKLKEESGNCTLGELAEYVQTQVNRESTVVNSRPQKPTIIYTPSMAESWEQIKLK